MRESDVEDYQRMQFDILLLSAVSRYVERAVQRYEGATSALSYLKGEEQVQRELTLERDFTDAVFEEAILNSPSGAAFVLLGLQRQTITNQMLSGRLGDCLLELAKAEFSKILNQKAVEAIEMSLAYDFSMGANQ